MSLFFNLSNNDLIKEIDRAEKEYLQAQNQKQFNKIVGSLFADVLFALPNALDASLSEMMANKQATSPEYQSDVAQQ